MLWVVVFILKHQKTSRDAPLKTDEQELTEEVKTDVAEEKEGARSGEKNIKCEKGEVRG